MYKIGKIIIKRGIKMKEFAPDHTAAHFAQLAEKLFIEWLIEDLDSTQLFFILKHLEIEVRPIKGKTLPVLFLKNKLLMKTSRTKFRDTELFPPFKWLLDIEDKLSVEKVLEAAANLDIPIREKALAYFMLNYYKEAYDLFEKRNEKIVEEPATEEKTITQETSVELDDIDFTPKSSKKLEKKLSQKIANLENERSQLQNQIKELQIEMNEKMKLKQNEITRLNGLIASEKNEKEKIYADTEQEKEQIIKEIDFLKQENDRMKLKADNKKKATPKSRKIALLGNPKNQSILKNTSYEIEIFDYQNFPLIGERAEEFAFIFLLTWRFSMEEFEKQATSEINKKTSSLTSFVELKEKLGELTNVD